MINSPPEPDQPPTRSQSITSNAELELLRQHTMRVLGSVAVELEAAGHQRRTLLAEVHTAEQTLQVLANERELAEAGLAASQTRVQQAATQLEDAQALRDNIVREVDELLSASLQRRADLTAEVAALERERDEFTKGNDAQAISARQATVREPIPAARPPVLSAARMEGLAAAQSDELLAAQPAVLMAAQVRSAVAHWRPTFDSIHPGFSNVATAVFVVLLVAMALLLTPLSQVFGGLKLIPVTSDSAMPGISTGSVLGVRAVAAAALKNGDMIAFANPTTPDVLVIRRIVSLAEADGQTTLTTTSDANSPADTLSVPASRAVARIDFALPGWGDVIVWLGSTMAKVAMVCLAILALGLSLASVQRASRNPLVTHQ